MDDGMFSSEYSTDSGTSGESDEPTGSELSGPKKSGLEQEAALEQLEDQLEVEAVQYGVSKPQREIIRAFLR